MSIRVPLWALVGVVLLSVGAVWGQGNEPPGYLVISLKEGVEASQSGPQRSDVQRAMVLVPAKGGEARQLFRYKMASELDQTYTGAMLSPQGNFILYSTVEGPKGFNATPVGNYHGRRSQFLAIGPGGDHALLTAPGEDGLGHFLIIPTTGEDSREMTILESRNGIDRYHLSADGRCLFYLVEKQDAKTLQMAFFMACQSDGSASTARLVRLCPDANDPPRFIALGVTPENEVIAVTEKGNPNPLAVAIAPDGSARQHQFDGDTIIVSDTAFRWSALSSKGDLIIQRGGQIYACRAKDWSERPLGRAPRFEGEFWNPRWSCDDQWFCWEEFDDQRLGNLCVAPVDGSSGRLRSIPLHDTRKLPRRGGLDLLHLPPREAGGVHAVGRRVRLSARVEAAARHFSGACVVPHRAAGVGGTQAIGH